MQSEIPGIKHHLYPQKPGIYLMKDKHGNILYIGKAKNLDKRIRSYFFKNNQTLVNNNWKTSHLISKINEIDYVITDNELEAFLLESNLIKRYRPVFNIELKDQQRYTYLKITDEEFPRLLVARRNRNGVFTGVNGEVIGPFVKGSSRYLTIGLLRKMFKIRICNKLPKKECLEYHIGNCDAPCINKVSEQQYLRNIQSLKNILNNNSNLIEFYKSLEVEMKTASQRQDYEAAIHIRDTLHRLKNLMQNQKMESLGSQKGLEDYIGAIDDESKKVVHVMMMTSKNGVINDMRKYEFDMIADNSIENFICQYYYSSPTIPSIIYVNRNFESKIMVEEVLNKISGNLVKIIPIILDTDKDLSNDQMIQDTERAKLYQIDDWKERECIKNSNKDIMKLITNNLSLHIEKQHEPALDELREILTLKKIPYIIDCFDISNFGNDYATGACTRFVNGKPNKTGYRRFRIKEVKYGQNDFQMMQEIIRRRYSKIDDKNKVLYSKKEEIQHLPDLIVIDGGRGHLNAALAVLKIVGLKNIECISIAKENEQVFIPSSNVPLNIPKNRKSLKILQHIRDEAHRFGLQYNKKLRNARPDYNLSIKSK